MFYFKGMKQFLIMFLALLVAMTGLAQDIHTDSDTIKTLAEVSVTAIAKRKIETELKMAVSVDEFLASTDRISFIKRGAFGWEPLPERMGADRSTGTRDGRRCLG